MHKDAYGYRPRGYINDEDIVYLLNVWDSIMEDQRIEDENRLEYLREEHGVDFKTEMEYYLWKEARDHEDWERQQVQQQEEAEYKIKLADPHSSVMAIELWDHGDEHLLVGA
jgi:glutamine synthetase